MYTIFTDVPLFQIRLIPSKLTRYRDMYALRILGWLNAINCN